MPCFADILRMGCLGLVISKHERLRATRQESITVCWGFHWFLIFLGRSWNWQLTYKNQTIYFETSPNGYGSIPINTIFRGMNIHLPAILMFTRGTRFWHTAKWSYWITAGFCSRWTAFLLAFSISWPGCISCNHAPDGQTHHSLQAQAFSHHCIHQISSNHIES